MIFLDLDGPILDVSAKYYRVYSDILINAGYETLKKGEYWYNKRWKIPEIEILRKTGADTFFKEYQEKRLSLIESDFYLSFDRLQEAAFQVLEKLSKKHKLILVTLRKSAAQLNRQLADLGLNKFLSHVLTSGECSAPRWRIKYNLISDYLADVSFNRHVFIGDTETDIEAGKRLGFTTIAVSNGIRSEELLKKSQPDYIFSSIEDVFERYRQKKILL